jgi:hypothetical protein
MKKLIYITIIILSNSVFAQNLTQSEFEIVNNDIRKTWFSIRDSKDFILLIKKFNLSSSDSILIENLVRKKSVEFTKQIGSNSHIMPFFSLAKNPNEIQLTIYSLTVELKRPNEEFYRGEYHFVLTTKIKIVDDNIIYQNSSLITDSNSINQWFLSGNKTYMEITKPFFEKYNYTPPPPPIPPSNLK